MYWSVGDKHRGYRSRGDEAIIASLRIKTATRFKTGHHAVKKQSGRLEEKRCSNFHIVSYWPAALRLSPKSLYYEDDVLIFISLYFNCLVWRPLHIVSTYSISCVFNTWGRIQSVPQFHIFFIHLYSSTLTSLIAFASVLLIQLLNSPQVVLHHYFLYKKLCALLALFPSQSPLFLHRFE